MRHAPRIAALITAIGVSFFLENGMILLVTPQPRTFPAVFAPTVYHIGGVVVNNQQILILASALLLMLALTYIVNKTKLGRPCGLSVTILMQPSSWASIPTG